VPLKLIKIEPGKARLFLIAAGVLCVIVGWFFIKWNFANALASQLDRDRQESRLVADWLTRTAPADPQIHFLTAALFEKTFDPADLKRSILEYETAAALSPNNYVMWVNLGKARNSGGDVTGAESAFRRAIELAPNYAAVQWVYGNFLVRQGNADEGFRLVSKAAAANPEFAGPAVTIAFQIFDGDLNQIRSAMGENDVTNSALAGVLASQKRYDEAMDAWSRLSDKAGKYKRLGETLATQLLGDKKYHYAARIYAEIQSEGPKATVGQISNGGFEDGVKLRNAGLFEWQIAEGAEPQIGLSDGQKRSGKYGLFMLFNTMQTAAFRSVSQTVPVEPGGVYELEVFYRSDIKTTATLKWEVGEAVTTGTIAATEPLTAVADWTPVRVTFTVPATAEAVIIRFVREGCSGPSCPVSGRISFDDLSIKRL
jgi:tetratricopeptide (TPR) repeat protein